MIQLNLTEDEFTNVVHSVESMRTTYLTIANYTGISSEYAKDAERLLVLLSRLLHAKNDQGPANATEAIQNYYQEC